MSIDQLHHAFTILRQTIKTIYNDTITSTLHQYLSWFGRKCEIHFTKKRPNLVYAKGTLVYTELGINIGSEIIKTRPCIVVSPSIFNNGDTVLVCPLTGLHSDLDQKPKNTSSHQYLVVNPDEINHLTKPSIINLGQMRAVSKKRLGQKIGTISANDRAKLHKKMINFFGIT